MGSCPGVPSLAGQRQSRVLLIRFHQQQCQHCLSATRAPEPSQRGPAASPRAHRAHSTPQPGSSSSQPKELLPFHVGKFLVPSPSQCFGKEFVSIPAASPSGVTRTHQAFGAVLAAEGKEGQSSEELKLLQFHSWAGSSLGEGHRAGWLCWMELLGLDGAVGAGWSF